MRMGSVNVSWLLVGVTSPVIFAVLLMLICAPLYFFTRKHAHANTRRDHILSMCNCFAAGVFLSACLLGLIPHAQEHERELMHMHEQRMSTLHTHEPSREVDNHEEEHSHGHYYLANLSILGGFLLIFVIEQFVVACEAKPMKSPHRETVQHTHHKSKEHAPVTAVYRSTSEGDVTKATVAATTDDDSDSQLLREDMMHNGGAKAVEDDNNSCCLERDHEIKLTSIAIVQSTTHGGHGHSHAPTDVNGHVSLRSMALLIGLSVHSILEGLAVGLQETTAAFTKLLFAVMAHEVLCAFAYGCSLLDHQGRHPVNKANMISACFVAATIPVGLVLGRAMPVDEENLLALAARFMLEGVAAGTFIYVACMEMLATEFSHQHSCGKGRCWPLLKTMAVCVGAALFAALSILMTAH